MIWYKQTYKTIAGTYYNGSSIPFSISDSDSYRGYCWSFEEDTGFFGATDILAAVDIEKTYSTFKNKETNIKLTYLHTYQTFTGSASLTYGADGWAGGITVDPIEKDWQIQVDVSGLEY